MRRLLTLGVLTIALLTSALAVDVLLVRAAAYDNADAIAAALTAGGHTVTIVNDASGGITIPATTQVVFLQGYVYPATATQVATWLNQQGGRGLVTTEWAVYYTASGSLSTLLAVTTNYQYSYPTDPVVYTQVTADPVMNNNLPTSFSFDGYYGVMRLTPKAGATVFYSDSLYDAGVAGWELSNGARTVSISAVAQQGYSLNSAEFRQLLVNAVYWAAAGTGPCVLEGDVNGDGVVNDADLLIVLFNFGNSCP
jgi:hypothetical protein